MSVEDCLARLATATVGHLAVTRKALPLVVPVRIRLVGNEIGIESLLGSTIPLTTGSVVALETDAVNEGLLAWSVQVRGSLRRQSHDSKLVPLHRRATGDDGYLLSTEEVSGWSTTMADDSGRQARRLILCTTAGS
jgi:hypothetical protein